MPSHVWDLGSRNYYCLRRSSKLQGSGFQKKRHFSLWFWEWYRTQKLSLSARVTAVLGGGGEAVPDELELGRSCRRYTQNPALCDQLQRSPTIFSGARFCCWSLPALVLPLPLPSLLSAPVPGLHRRLIGPSLKRSGAQLHPPSSAAPGSPFVEGEKGGKKCNSCLILSSASAPAEGELEGVCDI